MKKNRKKGKNAVPIGSAVAIIVGVVFGVLVIIGGATYFAAMALVPDGGVVAVIGEVATGGGAGPGSAGTGAVDAGTDADGAVGNDAAADETEEADDGSGTDVTDGSETDDATADADLSTAQAPGILPGQAPSLLPGLFPDLYPYTTITISAAGDTTLGGDSRWRGYHRFMHEFQQSGYDHSFFLRNVRDIFYASDLAILNLEGTLTYATEHMDKEFVFRGPPHFARILSEGAVDVVTIANNHTIDFFERGYRDTRAALSDVGVTYFGNEFNTIVEVNGIKVGLFGFRIWNASQYNRNRIRAAAEDLRERGAQLIIAYHHWGDEHVNMPNYVQRTMGRYTVAAGADLVLGAHPHVVQGIEVYRGVNIVYSLANFSFGGNSNQADFDSFIFEQTFTFRDGVLMDGGYNSTNLIPVMVSSTRAYNNFQPTVAEGADAERILGRLRTYSGWLE